MEVEGEEQKPLFRCYACAVMICIVINIVPVESVCLLLCVSESDGS